LQPLFAVLQALFPLHELIPTHWTLALFFAAAGETTVPLNAKATAVAASVAPERIFIFMSVSRIFHAWPEPIAGSETLPGSRTGKEFTESSSSRENAALQKIIRSQAAAMEIHATSAHRPAAPDFAYRRTFELARVTESVRISGGKGFILRNRARHGGEGSLFCRE
jgi:hypothetical protein